MAYTFFFYVILKTEGGTAAIGIDSPLASIVCWCKQKQNLLMLHQYATGDHVPSHLRRLS